MAIASLGRIQTRCRDSILHPFRWHPWTTGTPAKRLQLIPAGQERILNKYGYPPDLQDDAVKTVLLQAELLCADWAEGGENLLIVIPRSNPLLP